MFGASSELASVMEFGFYWTTRGYANSRTGRLADWSTRGCQRRLCVLSFHSFGGICETASCPVRDLSSPRVDQSARCPVRELAFRELAYPRVVQLLSRYSSTAFTMNAGRTIDTEKPSLEVAPTTFPMLLPIYGFQFRSAF